MYFIFRCDCGRVLYAKEGVEGMAEYLMNKYEK